VYSRVRKRLGYGMPRRVGGQGVSGYSWETRKKSLGSDLTVSQGDCPSRYEIEEGDLGWFRTFSKPQRG
jgi:hypothetical protein